MDQSKFRELMGQPGNIAPTPTAGYAPPAQPIAYAAPPTQYVPQTAPAAPGPEIPAPPTPVGTPAGFTRLSISGGGNTTDIKKQPGRTFQGRFLGRTDFKTKKGMDQVKWNFNAPDGSPFSVYGFTNLNRALEQVPVGAEVLMTYTGKVAAQTAFGVREVHQCTVDFKV